MGQPINSYIEFTGEYSAFEIFLFGLFAGIYAIRFFYSFFIYARLAFRSGLRMKKYKLPLSIIMAVRNEEANIREYLPGIITADYDDFEVIVVDDFSQDQSYTLLGLLREKYPDFRLSSLNQEMRHSTKQALNIACKAARKDWVFVASPSMSEIHSRWLHSFSEKIHNGKNIVVGYSNVLSQKRLINLLYRVELFLQQFQSFAFIKAGPAFVLHEDNLMFLKQKYFDIGGFMHDMDEEYGNLELIINKFISRKKASINLSHEGVVKKDCPVTLKKFKELLIKEVRLKRKLRPFRRIVIFIDELASLLILPVTIAVLVFFKEILIFVAVIVVIKVVLHILILFYVLKRLKEEKIFIPSLLYELLMPWVKLFVRWGYFRSLQKDRWNNN